MEEVCQTISIYLIALIRAELEKFATDVLPLPIPNATAVASDIDYFDKVGGSE